LGCAGLGWMLHPLKTGRRSPRTRVRQIVAATCEFS
jgi:hypothetical protein